MCYSNFTDPVTTPYRKERPLMTFLFALFFFIAALPAMLPLIVAAWPLILLLILLARAVLRSVMDLLEFFGL